MARHLWGLIAAAAGLGGCTTLEAEPASRVRTISYETGPCFGACPVYRVTVSADGSGLFEGRRFTAVEGTRAFSATPAQFRAFAAQLAPLRPPTGAVRYTGERCARLATDLPSADVEWTDPGGATQQLSFYFGCDMEKNAAIAERLRAAPDLLPIADFIRAPGDR